VLGLLMSMPLLLYGSVYVGRLLERYPALTPLGSALLGWLAGGIAVSDPIYADWIERQSPGLLVVVPACIAGYVLLQSRIMDDARQAALPLRPQSDRRRTEAARPQADPEPDVAPSIETLPALPTSTLPEGAAADAMERVQSPPVRASRIPTRRLAISTIAAVVFAGVVYAALSVNWVPIPEELHRYDCASGGVNLFYRTGGDRIAIETRTAKANGRIGPDNRIDWGDLHAVSARLGFVPPLRVAFADAHSVRVDGGMFEQVTCQGR
jgi:hypothetical protein